jgi:hypothetical protein
MEQHCAHTIVKFQNSKIAILSGTTPGYAKKKNQISIMFDTSLIKKGTITEKTRALYHMGWFKPKNHLTLLSL